MSSKYIRGIKIVYEDLGKGKPIVFIHGQPFNRSMWKYQSEAFSNDYRLLIPDLRGYGDSQITERIVLLDELALDIATLLDELQIEKAFLIGLSMGGQIALEFFKLFPQRVRGLVLADTDSRAEDKDGYKRRLILSEKIVQDGMKKFTDERIHHFISDFTIKNLHEVVSHLRDMMEKTNPAGAAAVQRGRADRKDLTPILESIKIPTLIMVGEDDEFTPIKTAQFIHERIENSKLSIIEKAGHIPNMEQAEKFNSILKAFLNENYKSTKSS